MVVPSYLTSKKETYKFTNSILNNKYVAFFMDNIESQNSKYYSTLLQYYRVVEYYMIFTFFFLDNICRNFCYILQRKENYKYSLV